MTYRMSVKSDSFKAYSLFWTLSTFLLHATEFLNNADSFDYLNEKSGKLVITVRHAMTSPIH
jgi:hypothetical protein